MNHPFQGSLVALPTPFAGAEVDLLTLARWVQAQAAAGTDGVVACGTTAETPTLTRSERAQVIETVLTHAGSMTVLAGVGTNSTRTTLERALDASGLSVDGRGVDGLLVVTPYYSRPTPAGLDLHFGAVADAVTLPIVLYNVPSRTGVDLSAEQAHALAARHTNIVAVKEATSSRDKMHALCGDPNLAVFCGEDSMAGEYMAAGAAGAIGVTGNVLPGLVSQWLAASRPDGNAQRARELAETLRPVIEVLFIESNPGPVKAALALRGGASPDVRPPLGPLRAESLEQIQRVLGEVRDECLDVDGVVGQSSATR